MGDRLLELVGARQSVPRELLIALAESVLESDPVRLACAVLDGGPLALAHAVRLALEPRGEVVTRGEFRRAESEVG